MNTVLKLLYVLLWNCFPKVHYFRRWCSHHKNVPHRPPTTYLTQGPSSNTLKSISAFVLNPHFHLSSSQTVSKLIRATFVDSFLSPHTSDGCFWLKDFPVSCWNFLHCTAVYRSSTKSIFFLIFLFFFSFLPGQISIVFRWLT